ncbi:Protein C1orf43 [Halotydeus destructor]|nr:Protein C1orf43 [Halotydeus destructor]
MANQLSGVAIIICIVFGFTTFVVIFIFGKRQIMRFALKSRRGAHVSIAVDAPKYLRKEIERRLDVVRDIKSEPHLLDRDSATASAKGYDHAYRMMAVDDLVKLRRALIETHAKSCPPGQDLKYFVSRMMKDDGPLSSADPKLITEFLKLYYHARHEPEPNFCQPDYIRYSEVLDKLIDSIKKHANTKHNTPARHGKDTAVALNGKTTVRVIGQSIPDENIDETSV